MSDSLYQQFHSIVTLCVRVWIEMLKPTRKSSAPAVTLCVRVWIEIHWAICFLLDMDVTLCVRVWIEIPETASSNVAPSRHPLREGVD